MPRGVTAPDPETIEAGGLTPPLVLKAYGPGLLHKSDAGAVRLHLASAEDAVQAAREMRGALAAQGITPDGFLVEEQSAPGVEVIVGAVNDAAFGPILLVGLGGVWTEVLHDTALRLVPITASDAHEMLDELRAKPLLDGFRGTPAIDRDALVEVLLAVSTMVTGLDFEEFELNPVICTPQGATAVDARLIGSLARLIEAGISRTVSSNGAGNATGQRSGFGGLFAPESIAVVGASTKKPNFGNMFLGFYGASGFQGRLVAVHPEADEIDGVPCVRSLAEADVEYALVAVPAKQCPDVVRQAKGIPYVQVMSGGFREMGNPELEEQLIEAARQAGTRLLGPNCMGVYSPRGGQTFLGGEPGLPGTVAMISQSGGMAGEVIKVGERRGLAYSKVATVGNCADVTPAELLRYLADDDETSTIGLYLEDPRDGRGLFEALQQAGKPVAALIGGRSGQGQQAAASHTGGMVSDTRIWDALAAQTGTAIVSSQDDLIGVLDFFDLHAHRAAAGTKEVLVIGPSGGASVLAADVFDAAGLEIAPLPDGAADALRQLGLGAGSSLANPLEIPVGPRADPGMVKRAVTAILSHGSYADVVTHVNIQSFFTFGTSADPLLAYAHAVGELQQSLPDTRVTLVIRNAECAPAGVEDAVRALAREGGVPVYRNMEAAAVAIRAGKTFRRNR
ncbi:MAG: CoA-binding domain protein [Actinomycetia bacterium]|nr:CoA-binding domain protein [Actinomycetes bacterium]